MLSRQARNFTRFWGQRVTFSRTEAFRRIFDFRLTALRQRKSSCGVQTITKIFKSALLLTSSATAVYLYVHWQKILCKEAAEAEPLRVDGKYDSVIAKGRDLLLRLKDEVGAPGLVVGVSVDGKTVWEEGFGYADIENRVPCSPNTVIRIASISKSITMTAVAKLWQEGKLDIDKPIQHYVPDFPTKTYNGEQVDITCRHLVSHLAGIRHYEKNPSKLSLHEDNSIKKERKKGHQEKKQAENSEKVEELDLKEYFIKDKYNDIKSALELFKDDALVCKPGSKFHYSTHGWTLVSAAVEKASQELFTLHITKLFKALGMYHTYLDVNDSLIYHRSRNYVKDKHGHLINAPYVDNSYKWAGGGFLSTVGDLLKFANAMLYSLQFQHLIIPPSDNEIETAAILEQNSKSIFPNEAISPKVQKVAGVKEDSGTAVVLKCDKINQLPGYLNASTVEEMWSPMTDVKDRDWKYAMGWSVLPEKQDCEFCRMQQFCVSHTGEAIGASSVLLVLPQKCHLQSPMKCKWSSPPKGIVVSILCNLQKISLSKTAQEIAEMFDNHSHESYSVSD